MLHIADILRAYLGLETWTLANRAGITMQDLADILYGGVVGGIEKYRKLAAYFGVSVDMLLRNDYTAMPVSFYETHPPIHTAFASELKHMDIAYKGEQIVLQMERQRVAEQHLGMAGLIMKVTSGPLDLKGMDFLNFDDAGQPMAIEVKSSGEDSRQAYFTPYEIRCAKQMITHGFCYQIVMVRNVYSDQPDIERYDFDEYIEQFRFRPASYAFTIIETKPVRGLKYFRMQAGLTQRQLAQRIGKCFDQINSYECGRRTPVAEYYLRASKFFGVPVNALLQWYDPQTGEVVPPPNPKKGEGNYASEGVEYRGDLSSVAEPGGPAAQPAAVCA